ncbi:MAG: glutathione peroxidase, partial [Gammaproteobacteria bacterium]|nr:glutathione peroxidase [Gammaproteobacteria bacterium]
MPQFNEFAIDSIDLNPGLLEQSAGKVVLAVNVASKCGHTPQYAGLEKLYQDLSAQGFLVMGFPCNQFGAQEPGSEKEISEFCSTKYSVSFPLSAKIEVNGDGRHALYAWLTDPQQGFPGDIEWNFEKFLIGRDGKPVARYPAGTQPDDAGLLQDIADAL